MQDYDSEAELDKARQRWMSEAYQVVAQQRLKRENYGIRS